MSRKVDELLGDIQDRDELLREFQWAEEHIKDTDVPKPAKEELEKIFKRIEWGSQTDG